MAVTVHQVTKPKGLSQVLEPQPAECVACFIRRTVVSGCGGTLALAKCWRLNRQRGASPPGRAPWQGAHCDCEVVSTIFEPCIFQIRTDDGACVPPRALAEVRGCFGVDRTVVTPCGMWSRFIPHPGPPWR